jgi:hypothetical protein
MEKSMSAYPQTCMSWSCGNIVCDGCVYRPQLVRYHTERGELAKYETGQAESRVMLARWKDESAARAKLVTA